MNNVRITWWVAGCAVAVALGGCRSASTRIYALGPAAPASHIDVYHAPALRVDTLNVPASWDPQAKRCVGRQRRYLGFQHRRLASLDASELDYRSLWRRPGRETQRRGIAQLYGFRRPGSSCLRLE